MRHAAKAAVKALNQSYGRQLPGTLPLYSHNSHDRVCALLGVCSRQQQQGDLSIPQVFGSRSIVTGHTHIPRAKHDRYRTPPKNYVQLLQHITRSRDVSSLSRLVQQYGKKFDAIHVAAAVAMMPKLYRPPQPGGHLNSKQMVQRKKDAARLMAQLQVSASSLVPRMFAGQVASITAALSRCSSLLPGGTTANSNTQALLDTLLTRVTADQGRLLWQGANGTSITNLLHGIATMGFCPSSSSSSSATAAARATTQHLCKIIARDSDRLHVRHLATAAWSLARLNRRRPGLLHASSATAALDAISAAVVARKLYLRPVSMTGLLTAAAWLGRRDEALLAAVAEEAVHQIRDLRPPHLSAFCWSFNILQYTPPPELTAGIVSQARQQLQHFNAANLGLLLEGLGGMGAHDKQLLADVAAGIAAEQQVVLAPRDAVRILAPYLAVPDAGSAHDVGRMAQLIASAVRREARDASPRVITDLLVIYSKLQFHHSLLLCLSTAVGQRGQEEFSLQQWVKVLQSAARLGYGQVLADPDVEIQLVRFYIAAEKRLQQHLRQVLLPAASGQPAQGGAASGDTANQQQEDVSFWAKLTGGGSTAAAAEQSSHESSSQQQQQQQQVALEVGAVVEMAQLLAQRGRLGESCSNSLAHCGVHLLPRLKLRQVMQLLIALTSREGMLGQEPVRQFVVAAAEHVAGLDLSTTPTATTTVLVGLLQPLSKAMSRDLVLVSGEPVMQAVYTELLPVLEECSQQQLQAVWRAMRLSGVEDEALSSRAKSVAQRQGWLLHPGSLSV